MAYIKNNILHSLNNSGKILAELKTGLTPYLEYYSMLRLEQLINIYSNFESYNIFSVRGVSGSGKSSFKTIFNNSFEDNINVFNFTCNNTTELDDIFLALFKFKLKYPLKKDVFKTSKSNFKPSSIDEQIISYLKNTPSNLVLLFDNYEKLINDNGDLKAENIKSFFELLASFKNIKVMIYTGINYTNTVDTDKTMIFETKLNALDEKETTDFLNLHKINLSHSIIKEIYKETNGYIFSLKFLLNTANILSITIPNLLKEKNNTSAGLNEFLAQKLMFKLSEQQKNILACFAIFRHEINANIIKYIFNFENIEEDLEILKKYMLIDGDNNCEMRDFLQIAIYNKISDRQKISLHEKTADFYADQIPLKPNERTVELSRSTMYSEKFYHYNKYSKLLKNSELQKEKFKNSTEINENKTTTYMSNSQKIQYIASTKYIPDFELKQETNKEVFSGEKNEAAKFNKTNSEIILSDEEKALLAENDNENDNENENEIFEIYDKEEYFAEPHTDTDNENFDDNPEDIEADEPTEAEKGWNLFQKGMELFNRDDTLESINYLKNAIIYLENADYETCLKAELYLAKAYADNYKFKDATGLLTDMLQQDLTLQMQIDVQCELADIYEFEKKHEDALSLYKETLTLAQTNNLLENSGKIYFKIALTFDDLNKTDKALYNYIMAATEATEVNDCYTLASAYSNIASIYEEKNDEQKAIEYYKKSLKADNATQNFEGQTKTLIALGNIFASKDIKLAVQILIKATTYANKTNDNYLIASSYLTLGDAFFEKEDYKNSIKAFMIAKKHIDNTVSTDSKNKIERRFDMIVNKIGETAYKFLLSELKNK